MNASSLKAPSLPPSQMAAMARLDPIITSTNIRCIHQFFEKQAEKTPEATAIVFEGQQLTYRELNTRANQLAHRLRSLGVRPDSLVGISMHRSIDLIVAILGVLKAGGAFLPLDPVYPADRLRYMVEDSSVGIVLTHQALAQAIGPYAKARLIVLDASDPALTNEPITTPTNETEGGNLAYVIYTSGSTGRPKGVMLHHRGLINLVQAQIDGFAITQNSRLLQFASISFDAAVSEIFTVLVAGGTLVLAQQDTLKSIATLRELLIRQKITVATIPPSLLAILPADGLSHLQTLVSAGESCSWEIAEKWRPGRRFINAYGPTETTIGPTMFIVGERIAGTNSVPIGRAIPNMFVRLLEPGELKTSTPGQPGEICIGGIGLARGYLNNPEQTAQRFIADPFATANSGERLYRTGDLARELPGGDLEYLGRIDTQVKIRGFRIELGEIESALRTHTDVADAAVIAREDIPGNKQLVAYLIAKNTAPTTEALRDYLRSRLPDYMVPTSFVTLAAFPLTPNGKVDRRAFPAPPPVSIVTAANSTTELNAIEQKIHEIWIAVLHVPQAGLDTNFFDLGGNSLHIADVHHRLQTALSRTFPVTDLFAHTTIRALAQHFGAAGSNVGTDALQDRALRQRTAQANRRSFRPQTP
jgi:amino acid adenylation domain-containing protein